MKCSLLTLNYNCLDFFTGSFSSNQFGAGISLHMARSSSLHILSGKSHQAHTFCYPHVAQTCFEAPFSHWVSWQLYLDVLNAPQSWDVSDWSHDLPASHGSLLIFPVFAFYPVVKGRNPGIILLPTFSTPTSYLPQSLIHWPLIYFFEICLFSISATLIPVHLIFTLQSKWLFSKQKYANVQHLLGAMSGLEWPEPGVPGEAGAGEETREAGWDVGQWKSFCYAQSINMEGML